MRHDRFIKQITPAPGNCYAVFGCLQHSGKVTIGYLSVPFLDEVYDYDFLGLDNGGSLNPDEWLAEAQEWFAGKYPR